MSTSEVKLHHLSTETLYVLATLPDELAINWRGEYARLYEAHKALQAERQQPQPTMLDSIEATCRQLTELTGDDVDCRFDFERASDGKYESKLAYWSSAMCNFFYGATSSEAAEKLTAEWNRRNPTPASIDVTI